MELKVTYRIDDAQRIRLLELLEVVKKYEIEGEYEKYPFKDMTLESLFSNLMLLGSKHKIDDSIDEYAWLIKK